MKSISPEKYSVFLSLLPLLNKNVLFSNFAASLLNIVIINMLYFSPFPNDIFLCTYVVYNVMYT